MEEIAPALLELEALQAVFATQLGKDWGLRAREVAQWQRDTFGCHEIEASVRKYYAELDELRATAPDSKERCEEAVDCFFMAVSCVAAGCFSVPLGGDPTPWTAYLWGEVYNRVMARNKARKWKRGEDGTFSHVGKDGKTKAERSKNRG